MYRMSQKGSVQYLETEAFAALDGVTHAFCTRNGGVSAGPYASLNTGFLSGDRKEDVLRNLALIGEAFAIPRGGFVLMGQVHGNRISVIDGNGSLPESIPECDGLITDRPGVALGIRTADCVPLLFADPVRRVIGVAHAGWRGTASRIASRMVDLFEERFSTRREDLLVAVGPAIGGCCYQVDAPVVDAFAPLPGAGRFLRPCPEPGRWMLDLDSANRSELNERGVPAKHVHSAGYCTACRKELFFSHRAHQGRTGRQINFLMLNRDGR
jgi:YfiH family protein